MARASEGVSASGVSVQLIPIDKDDMFAITEALRYLNAFLVLLHPRIDDPWIGLETIRGLERIRDRKPLTYEFPVFRPDELA